jgi:aldose 1-epimerase
MIGENTTVAPAAAADPGWTVRESSLGGIRTLEVESSGSRAIAVVALRGATLLTWRVGRGGDDIDLLDGYISDGEFATEDGMRSAIMAPFTNRVSRNRYSFEAHDLMLDAGPGADPAQPVMHGLVRQVDFQVTGIRHDAGAVIVELTTGALRPEAFAGYPFTVDVAVTYTITPDTIEVRISGTNSGVAAAPFSCGWHPYFRIGDVPLSRLRLCVPARARVVTGPDLIPLDGADAYATLEDSGDRFDFRLPRAIGDLELDTCFLELEPGPDGLIHTTLTSPEDALTLDVWQERGGVHVYTADDLARDRRGSLAIEPVEALTNAVNRADQACTIRLEPGETRSFRFGVTVRHG